MSKNFEDICFEKLPICESSLKKLLKGFLRELFRSYKAEDKISEWIRTSDQNCLTAAEKFCFWHVSHFNWTKK